MTGEAFDAASTMVPVDDRGLAYGDGVFETLACTNGSALALDAHLNRIERGCSTLGFTMPDREQLHEMIAICAQGPGPGVIKLIVTRGSGGRGYEPPSKPVPRVRVSRHSWPEGIPVQRRAGVNLVRLSARLADNPVLAGLKHLNRLEQVLAARELSNEKDAQEGIVYDQAGHPVCGVMSNLFLVLRGELVTPDLGRCGVEGIIRETLLASTGKQGLPPISVRQVDDRELDGADEIFMSNSIRGVLPVRRLDRRSLAAPGSITALAQRVLGDAGVLA